MAFKIVSDQKFDLAIMALIGLNTMIMCFEHHHQTTQRQEAMEAINQVFMVLFPGGFLLKLIGQRWYYFKDSWNIFDVSIVIFSIVCEFYSTLIYKNHPVQVPPYCMQRAN